MSIRRSILTAAPVVAVSAVAATPAVAAAQPVVIQLPGADLGLVSVRPSNPTLAGAYDVSNQQFREGNSEYSLVLSAPESALAGSYLTFRFAAI